MEVGSLSVKAEVTVADVTILRVTTTPGEGRGKFFLVSRPPLCTDQIYRDSTIANVDREIHPTGPHPPSSNRTLD